MMFFYCFFVLYMLLLFFCWLDRARKTSNMERRLNGELANIKKVLISNGYSEKLIQKVQLDMNNTKCASEEHQTSTINIPYIKGL